MARSLHELIAATSELRTLPSTTLQLTALLDDITVDAASVLAIIEKDPSLTSNLLKLANSAYYGLRRQVGSTREALVLLGNQTVINLAFAASMGDILRGPLAAYRLERNQLWHHALGSALAAAHLVRLDGGEVQHHERAFTAGLVHDIGKLLLNRPLKGELEQLPKEADSAALLAAERRILGFDHAEAGAALAESWNFPPLLVEAIARHHDPDRAQHDPELVRAVSAANLVVCRLGWGDGTAEPDEEVFRAEVTGLGYREQEIQALLQSLPENLENMLNMIGHSP